MLSHLRFTNRKRQYLRLLFNSSKPPNVSSCSASSSLDTPEVDVSLSTGRVVRISSGRYARFANGSAVVTVGDTAVMVTAVAKQKPSSASGSFLPLMVDYRQKAAAAGRIPTNFLRRELGPSEKEILAARLVDRSVRPLFPAEFRCDTQLVCNMLAIDASNLPDVQAINAASAALALSDIPWNGPIGAVRVGLVDSEIIINPTRRELQCSSLDLIVAATKQNLVVMLEGRGNVVNENDFRMAVKKGTQEAQLIIYGIERLQRAFGKPKRALEQVPDVDQEIEAAVRTMAEMRLREIFNDFAHDKISRDQAITNTRVDTIDKVWSSYPSVDPMLITEYFNRFVKTVFRGLVFEDDRRCDGRLMDDLRRISCSVNIHKPLHGSALFQRGQTQVFATVALDSPESALKLDPITSLDTGIKSKNFFLHYEFPPYATGETGKIGPVGRREIGHGALAEKGLLPIIPNQHPFTIRLTAEVLESNGSSSMATVCAGSMALMDAGIPVQEAAAGVAIGLITKYENNDTKHLEDYRILTDLLGIEDYMGDMDMKVAGTRKGMTAIQADIKVPGIPLKVVMESLQKAMEARHKILDIMNETIGNTRTMKKDCWPVTDKLLIEPHQRTKLLGPGGMNVRRLYLETGVQVTQEDENTFRIFAPSDAAMHEAKEFLEHLMKTEKIPDLEFGAIYTAKIVELRDTGVMVTLYPSMPPTLLHNSQLDQRKIAHPSALGLEEGTEIQVKYFGRDPVSGFMRLSRKVLQGPASSAVKNLDRSALNSNGNGASATNGSSGKTKNGVDERS
ncbi:polyribonucleotide nucleotidyltransferase 1, mitochondrial [Toxorhynchites rutilus septentrionalis]|uniref:polyribonucleotide nucleotidyltransferase 1, mitochondrial n=1 Tax=Toxorhynchites rutilus septentrionalis TaxID=329112 RepID=UPI00247847B2|nr:polyribonucleotide nucleotidyltransferase 1, mitochondrial [Toxorhynchites rutilus septentrionalis]